MKCPKCGYNSFDHLESCKKCGKELTEFRSRFNLRSLIFPAKSAPAVPVLAEPLAKEPASESAGPAPGESVDFGYDFMDDESPDTASSEQHGQAGDAAFGGFEELSGTAETAITRNENPFAEIDEDVSFDNEDAVTEEEPDIFSFEDPKAGPEDPDRFSFDGDLEKSSADGAEKSEEFDLDWDDEPLPDLSLEEQGDAVAEPSRPLKKDALPFADEEALEVELDEGDNEAELPPLEEIDFDGLGDDGPPVGEGEGQEKKAPNDHRVAKEGPADPFDCKESSGLWKAPLSMGTRGADEGLTGLTSAGQAAGQGKKIGGRIEAPDSELPGLAARLGAFWIDMVLVAGVFLLFLVTGNRLLSPAGQAAILPSLQAVLEVSVPYYLLLFLLCFTYFTVFHFWFGQTPGKMLFGLHLQAHDGGALRPSEAFLHTVGGLVSLLAMGAGFLTALADPYGRGWNDRLAGTRLVFTPPDKEGRLMAPRDVSPGAV